MTLKARMLIPMIIMVIIVASTMLISNTLHFSGFVNTVIKKSLNMAILEILNEIELLKARASVTSLYFSSDPEIITALETMNREALLKRAAFMYNETSVELCAITDRNGIAFIRPHAPEVYHDDISMIPSVRLALAGQAVSTVELGYTVGISAAAGTPIYNRLGQIIGTVVAGFRLDTNEFVDHLKSMSGSEFAVFIGEKSIATTLYNNNGVRAIGEKAPEHISQKVLAGNVFSGQGSILGRELMAEYYPLSDIDGQVIGMLFAGNFMTEKDDMVNAFIVTGIQLTVILLVVSILFILFFTIHVSSIINKMLEQIHYDAVTGIYNRRFFDEHMGRLIKTLARSKGMLSVMMIDIDFFKYFNDTYGHSHGDLCLKIVAETLSKSVTRDDDFIVRYGGEEFVTVLPNTDEAGAQLIAKEMLENIENRRIPHRKNTASNYVTISIGVTTSIASHTQETDDYINRADEMMYESKHNGRNRYTFGRLTKK